MTRPASNLESSVYLCHIIIIGGGLAGLATALGLRKLGHTVTVLERVPEFSKVGIENFRLESAPTNLDTPRSVADSIYHLMPPTH